MSRNAVFIDDEGARHMAVILKANDDGSVDLTYQAGGRIHTVTAVRKGDAYHGQEPKKEQA